MVSKALGSLVIAACLMVTAAAAADEGAGIERCRTIADNDDRLECYDRMAMPADAGQPATAAADDAPAMEPAQSAVGLPAVETATTADPAADIGLPKPKVAMEPVPVTIDRCGMAGNRIFYIYFDNGQVWRYIGRKSLRLKSCGKEASLVEDRLGFVLQLHEHSKSIRVQRLK